jgi:hypothetical protein
MGRGKVTEDTYTCAACERTFPKVWSDDEALDEYIDKFGLPKPEDDGTAVVCDDCYRRLITGEAK